MRTFSKFLAERALSEGPLKGDLQKVKDSVIEWLEDQDVRLGKGDVQNGVFGDFFRITIDKEFEYTYNGKEIKVFDVKKDKQVATKPAGSREAQSEFAKLVKKYSKV